MALTSAAGAADPTPPEPGSAAEEAPTLQLTEPQAAAELPHRDLDRSEVVDLLSGVFEVQLQSAAGPFDDLAVQRFVSGSAALVEAGQLPAPGRLLIGKEEEARVGESRLLESTFPLRNDGEVIDLSLESSDDGLEPVNPLVDVKLPAQLGAPIELSDGEIGISLVDAPDERAPSRVEDTAVYPNVAQDTDFVAAPTPNGVETMTLLRSPDAPQSHSYALDLPEGATLREEAGGAVVEDGDRLLLRIRPPYALAADGSSIPTSLTVAGDSIEVKANPDEDTAWPVLVDPFFESYTWYGGVSEPQWSEWDYEGTNTPGLGVGFGYNVGTPYNGIFARALPGSYSPGNYARVSHEVPRLRQEQAAGRKPSSYFTSMTLTNVATWANPGSPAPYASAGIIDVATNYWAGQAGGYAEWSMGLSGYGMPNSTITITGAGSKEAKLAIAAMMKTNEYATVSSTGQREMYVGGASFEIADDDDPTVSNGSASTVWANQVSKSPIAATLSDNGLGAKRLRFELPGQNAITIGNSCAGNMISPCPASWRPSVSAGEYNAAAMPQGWLSIPITGEDVVGHKSKTALAEIGIDHTAPALSSLSGSLTQQGTLGTHKLQYDLTFGATDGFEAPTTVQKSFGANGSGNGQFKNPFGVAIDSGGTVYVVDRNNNRVQKFDQQGNYLGQFGNAGTETEKLFEPRMIAVAANGNLWVTDTGHQRLAQYTPAGAYVRQFKDSTLTGPYGITAAPGGYIWFTDINSDEVVKAQQNADGSLSVVLKVKGDSKPPGPNTAFLDPGGLTADSQGNVWVTDIGNNRLQKITSAGVIAAQLGGLGSGISRFSQPYGVAVTPLGHLLVADSENNRLQLLDTQGDMLRIIGAGTFSSPKGIALGPNNSLFVTDWNNHRVQKWSNVDLDSQSGVVKSEILVDGQVREVFNPPCSGEAVCSISPRSWTLNAREYTEGAHTVEVAVVDGVGLRSVSAPLNVELHPDRTAPQVTLGGTMTEQASLGSTRPSYKLKVTASDPEPKEGSMVFDGAFGGVGGFAAEGKFETPMDADADGAGNVWVVDTGNNRLEKFNAQGQFLQQTGSSGTGAGQLRFPSGLTVDPSGNIWVADTQNNRIVEFGPGGAFVAAFGRAVNKTKVESGGSEAEQNACTAASGNVCQAGVAGGTGLQFNAPRGIAATSGGNIWIADTGSSRLVKITPSGSVLNTLTTLNAELGKLKEPEGIAVAADGSIWALDSGNDRVAQWNSSLAFVRKVGSQGSGFGQFNHPTGIDIDAKGNVWVADITNRRVQQFSSTGQYLMGYGTGNAAGDTIGAWMPSGLAFGSQDYLYVVDYMNRRVQRWAPSAMSQSGIVSSTVKVDGKVVDSYAPGCPTENCTLSREWTMQSNSFSAGTHLVEAIVADGSGLTTTKSVFVNIQRDTVAPQLVNTGPLAEAPEGWVEQKTYAFTATATDAAGYGVKQIRLLIDGNLVGETLATACEAGGCSKARVFNVNVANYDGGAHEVAVVAEDGAGNWKKQTWTMNVDPSGPVSSSEATDTLEAMEETVPPEEEFEPVASTLEFLEQQLVEDGDNPHFKTEEGHIVSFGVTTETEIDPATDTITSEGTEGPLEITPQNPVANPEIVEGAAAVMPATGVAADTVVRPEYNGLQMFTTIREYASPEAFEWHVNLNSGQYMVQANEQQIEIHSKTGAVAWLISAEAAHDATGKPVPTSVAVSGASGFTLNVKHRGQGFTYPVSAGSSYETGYATVTVITPVEEAEEAEEAEEPLSPEEVAELDAELVAWSSNSSAQRPRNKPIKRKQAKRILRVKRKGLQVPAPTASASGGPGSCCEEPYVPIETQGKVCSNFNCDIWDVEIQDGYFHKTKKYVTFGSEPKCDDDVLWYWKLNILISNQSTPDHLGPGIAYAGKGQHLTYRCTYSAFIGPIPEEYVLEAANELQLRIYPNGYQSSHALENNWKLWNKVW